MSRDHASSASKPNANEVYSRKGSLRREPQTRRSRRVLLKLCYDFTDTGRLGVVESSAGSGCKPATPLAERSALRLAGSEDRSRANRRPCRFGRRLKVACGLV